MSTIDLWVPITFVSDVNTPLEVMQYDGKTFLIAPEMLNEIGSGPTNPGKLLGVRGYRTTGTDGSAQWLMTSPVSPAIVDAFNLIPGANGWTNLSARNVYINIGLTLLEQFNVTAPDVLTLLQKTYDAAALDVRS